MFKRFKNKINVLLKNKEYKPLIENFASLTGLQAINYLLPLITLPYLVRVLGPDKYGLIAFATAFVMYFQILSSYGFNLSATKEISIHRNNKAKISEIFSSVILIKAILTVLSLLLLSIIIIIIPQFKINWQIYFFTFGTVIGGILFPIWFFQGIEKMKYITILNVISQVIFTISIFIFIKDASDYLYVPLINSLGFIFAGILGFIIAFKVFDIELKLPTYKNIKFQFIEGWHVFISTLAISLYTNSNAFILGILTNNIYVGYYAAAEKIIIAAIGVLGPITQTFYPYISKKVNESKKLGIEIIRKITLIMGSIGLILSLIIFIFADLIINILFGAQYSQSILVLRILAFLPLIVGLSNVFGIQTMLTFNYKKAFSRIILIMGILNIMLALILVPLYMHIGTAISFLITETLITLIMFIYLNNKGIKILGIKNV